MPGYVIHLAVAEEYLRKHSQKKENYNQFINGTIFPDSVMDKSKTHYGDGSSNSNLYKFLLDRDMKTSFNRGYFLHLLSDYLFYNKYIQCFSKKIYDDYDLLNKKLIDKYKVTLMRIINDNCEFVTVDLLRNIDESRRNVAIRIGYVPGTYDLLHSGHIENIKYAQNMCDIIVVGVNFDELVWKNKAKKTMQSQDTRKFIMEHVKGVDQVILASTNDKRVINEKIVEITGYGIDAIFLGGDLKGKDAMNQEGDLDGVDYIYTPRSETKMKTVSSTVFRKSFKIFRCIWILFKY